MDGQNPKMRDRSRHSAVDALKKPTVGWRYGFERSDAEDIEQDLLLDYLKRSKSFDARRCDPRTFAQHLVNHHAATIVEARRAGCREYRARPAISRSALRPSGGSHFVGSCSIVLAVCVDRFGTRPIEAILNRGWTSSGRWHGYPPYKRIYAES